MDQGKNKPTQDALPSSIGASYKEEGKRHRVP